MKNPFKRTVERNIEKSCKYLIFLCEDLDITEIHIETTGIGLGIANFIEANSDLVVHKYRRMKRLREKDIRRK